MFTLLHHRFHHHYQSSILYMLSVLWETATCTQYNFGHTDDWVLYENAKKIKIHKCIDRGASYYTLLQGANFISCTTTNIFTCALKWNKVLWIRRGNSPLLLCSVMPEGTVRFFVYMCLLTCEPIRMWVWVKTRRPGMAYYRVDFTPPPITA